MKSIHIVGDSKWGGGGPIIVALAGMARELGCKVDILATDPVCQKMMRSHGLGIIDLNVIWREVRPLRDLRGLYSLYRFLKAHRYDVVHTHTSKGGFVGRIAARLAGVPVIIHTAHGFPFHEESGAISAWIYRQFEKGAAHFCDRVVTVSHFHRSWGIRLGIANSRRLVAIPNGISEQSIAVTKESAAVRAELGLSPDKVLFFTPGRLSQGKGLEYLVDAIPLLQRKLQQRFQILLAGEGPLRDALEQRISAAGCGSHIRFLGFRTDIGNLLNACDVVVLPSLHEGMSISLLEAMAAGKPIIATSIGGNLEPTSNGEEAIIVPPRNSEALANAMLAFAEDPDLQAEKAARARRRYRENYTLGAMIRGYKTLYQQLITEKVEASAIGPARPAHSHL